MMFKYFSSLVQKLPVRVPIMAKQCISYHNVAPAKHFLGTVLKRDMSFFQKSNIFTYNLTYKLNQACVQDFLKPQISISNPSRGVTKFSLVKGKRKTVKCVLKRFKRLHWGIWIRTRTGRHKKMFKKSAALKRRLKQHIFVNANQSWLLDSMVTNYWRKPKYYLNDPYEQYHKREEYFATRKKPLEYKAE